MKVANLVVDEKGRYRAMFEGRVLASSADREYVINSIRSGANRKANDCGVTDVVEAVDIPSSAVTVHAQNKIAFSINERFEFTSNMVQMVIDGVVPSIIISGEGGLGKTHTVLEEIKKAGLTFTTEYQEPIIDDEDEDGDDGDVEEQKPQWKNPGDVHVVKGYSTAKGLYRTLYENNGCLIIFDDCDSIQKDATAINVLKSALDSYDERWVHWNAEMPFSDPLPRQFLFTGKIIFISNMTQAKIDQAIKSRCLRVDLTMTTQDKIERMETVIVSPNFLPNYSMDIKRESLAFLSEHADQATDLNMRTLIAVCHIRAANKPHWDKLALYTITA